MIFGKWMLVNTDFHAVRPAGEPAADGKVEDHDTPGVGVSAQDFCNLFLSAIKVLSLIHFCPARTLLSRKI